MENHIDHPLTVTVEEAAKLLGIGRSTAYELIHTGDIPSLRLGRRLVVPVSQIATRLGVDHDAIWATLTVSSVSVPPISGQRIARSRRGKSSRPPTLF